jgi:mycothiol synthase
LSQPFDIRPASARDAGDLAQLLNDCTLAYQGIARSSPDDAIARLHRGGANPATDSFIVSEAGRILGFANVWRDGPEELKLFARTHPGARGRGIGRRLLQLCEERAATLSPGVPLTTTHWAADRDAPPLLAARSYRPVRHFLRMEIDASSVPPNPGAWPPSVACETLAHRPEAEPPLYQAWRAAFEGHWGRSDQSPEEFWDERRNSKIDSALPFDPSLWLLAFRDGELIGFCLCELGKSAGEPIGRVSELGVVPSHRGIGVGYGLLSTGLTTLRDRGAAGSSSTSIPKTRRARCASM